MKQILNKYIQKKVRKLEKENNLVMRRNKLEQPKELRRTLEREERCAKE